MRLDVTKKQSALVEVFQSLLEWLDTKGFESVDEGPGAERHTLEYRSEDHTICSLQFCGTGNNEYLRFRFYTDELIRRGILDRVRAILVKARTASAKFGTTPTHSELHLDFHASRPETIRELRTALDPLF